MGSVTLKNYKSALLVGKEKENPKMLIIFVCFFFNLFRERKLIKVVFSMFPFSFLAHVSREEKRNFIFIVFFYYTLLTGEGKGVNRNFHFTLILYFLTYYFHKSIKACDNF